jgi:hypothetical protein
MKVRALLAAGILSLSLAAIGSAKSWDVYMDSPTKAGSVVIPAGSYSVKLDNSQALFIDQNSGKKFTVPVKVQNADHKYSTTQAETAKQDGTQVLKTIELGGTNEELNFGE